MRRAFELQQAFSEIAPLTAIREGFVFEGERVSFGSFQKGIHRARQQRGSAALSLVTAPPKPGRPRPYEDEVDLETGSIFYHYRAGSPHQPDNRALRAALELEVPLIFFWGIDAGQYQIVAPTFVTADDQSAGVVMLEVGLPNKDVQGQGIVSASETRRYRMTQVAARYHQARFRREVLRAYRQRCAICALREPQLVEASHIIRDADPDGVAAVVNGIALCAIHHLAYDRNLMGIDPSGVVHIGERLLRERDGPMLSSGLQGFHGASIAVPGRAAEHPDPARLAIRFDEFLAA